MAQRIKVKMARFFWPQRVDHWRTATLTLVGQNKNGTSQTVVLENLSMDQLVNIARVAAQAAKQLHSNSEKSLNNLRSWMS